MSDIAIRAESIGKRYRLGAQERYRTLRDTFMDALSFPIRRFRSRNTPAKQAEQFWALKDVSFDVKHGDVIGVIGRNGAGKSTLLKILSRITEPTEGQATIHGRISSLLEVGTGFHPELTGRENIYLNGAILGMKRAEIQRKFDAIVSFAEVEKFIDTPVKHYSSGMYVRLAFAVAAQLEPDILVVDEVLAVGDAAFQKKCLGKMSEVSQEGRTILFVSHSMASITTLCKSAILLREGKIQTRGDIGKVIDEYMLSLNTRSQKVKLSPGHQNGRAKNQAEIVEVAILDRTGQPRSTFNCGEDVIIDLMVEAPHGAADVICVILVRTLTGIPVLHVTAHEEGTHQPLRISGTAKVRCALVNCPLYPGSYSVSVWLGQNAYNEVDLKNDVLTFHVEQGELLELGFDLTWRHGLVHVDSRWQVEGRSYVSETTGG